MFIACSCLGCWLCCTDEACEVSVCEVKVKWRSRVGLLVDAESAGVRRSVPAVSVCLPENLHSSPVRSSDQ